MSDRANPAGRTATMGHVPVMLREVLEFLKPPSPDCLMVDATLGLAGHAGAFLEKYPELRLVGVDADPEVQAIAKARLEPYGGRVSLSSSFFDEYFIALEAELALEGDASIRRPGLVLFDFGVSMYHFRESGRGFSLQADEALDMRLRPSLERTAADLVNTLSQRELFKTIAEYGEEPFAFRISKAIERERAARRIETSGRLAEIVKGAVPPSARRGRTHPATRTFQALRIAVNDELGRIERGLKAAIACLAPGGLVACISFHSLEDRIVKLAFRAGAAEARQRRYAIKEAALKDAPEAPIGVPGAERSLAVLTGKPVEPSAEEIAANPASRSAKLRVARAEP